MDNFTYNESHIKLELHLDTFLNYMHHAPVGYLIINREGTITHVNQVLLRASDYSAEELVNQHYHKLIYYNGDYDDLLESLKSSTTEELPRLIWKNSQGEQKTSKVIIWNAGELIAISFLDIHKLVYPSLFSRFAENFVAETNIGLLVIDKDQNVVEISPLASRLLEVNKQDILNRPIDEVFKGIPDEHRIVQRALINGITVSNQAAIWSINHQRYDLLVDSNTIKDEVGNIVGAYVIFKDVTNLRSLEQQVLQNDRLATIGQIAAGTAHEIRNPLTSIKGFLQMLRSVLSENNFINEYQYTEIMLSEIERINKLVNEILLLSKPKDIKYQSVDANKVLLEILPIIRNEGMLRNVDVKYQLVSILPAVIADTELLKQVFLNIAKNGIEAISNGGTLTITSNVDEEKQQVVISIHDTGEGIPNYIMDKIFDPFFTTKEKGTGLGLSICQKIIHDLGGSIRVSNKGFGTSFLIYLPFK